MPDVNFLENYRRLKESIAEICLKNDRSPDDVELVAVSKFHPIEAIETVAGAGQLDFGENYVQELLKKKEALADLPLRWHMTGHIQSRKAAKVVGEVVLIHTLDSIKLADALERGAREKNVSQPVLIEVNIGDEPQKAGASATELPALADHVLKNCPSLRLDGLMCLPPVFDAGEASRPYFARLRELKEKLESSLGARLPSLSMGMSGDYEAAIAEGATIVRVGSNIFGPRPIKAP